RKTIGVPIAPVDRANHERCATAVRAGLADAEFAAAWAEGRAMTLEEAVVCALGEAADE
ncbi:MAG: hypothetical protein HY660_07460, partial [Armatimonadetes bacterium]|nr:hypothetical protein [Armatimonadota bacterium]